MQTFRCVRDIEKFLEEGDFEINTGVIGTWASSNEEVSVTGIFIPTGRWQSMFPRLCVRWKTGDGKGKGMFSKGIAGYTGVPINPNRFKNLKVVR